MLDPYRMVVVNVIALFSLIAFLGITKYIFHKNIKPIIIVFLFSLLPIISVFRKGIYESGDFTIHIYRTISFYENLKNINLMPSWGHGLNGDFGYPIFLIINPLPYYIISIFHFFDFSFINSMKLFLILTYILSGVFMYIFTKKLFKNELASIGSSIFYLYAPYRLIDLHFRNDIGEVLAFCIFPLCCLYFYNCLKKNSIFDYTALGILFGLLILSHQGIGLVTLMYIFVFFLFFTIKNGIYSLFKQYKLIYSLILAFTISAYALIPYFTYTKFTLLNISSSFSIATLPLKDILFSPWRYGLLFQGPNGELSHIIGYIQIFVILALCYLFFKNKLKSESKNLITFFLISTILFSYMLINQSRFFWEVIPLIENLIISSRLLFIVVFNTSILAGYLILNINKKILIYLFIFTAISFTILNWGNRKTIESINDQNLQANLANSTYEGEGYALLIPKWVGKNSWIKNYSNNKLESNNSNAEITNILDNPQEHTYLIKNESKNKFTENTWYFPGWKVYVNNKPYKFTYLSADHPGLITFELDKGFWKVKILYEDLFYFKIIKLISVSTFSFSLIYLIYLYSKNKFIRLSENKNY